MTGLRWSTLRWMRQSPAHFRYFRDRPIEPTPAMRFGTLVHALAFDQKENIRVWVGQRRGKAWTEFRDRHADCDIYTLNESQDAERLVGTLFGNHHAAAVLQNGEIERRIKWTMNGVQCHGTPDVWDPSPDALVLADLKVTNDSSPAAMQRQVVRMGWHGQLAWYADAIERLYRTMPDRIVIVAVEPKAPFANVVYDLSSNLVQQGRVLYRTLFDRYCYCTENDFWPSYTDSGATVLDADDAFTITIDGEEIAV